VENTTEGVLTGRMLLGKKSTAKLVISTGANKVNAAKIR
jgi:hypothetical protein